MSKYKSLSELSNEQLFELKQNYLCNVKCENHSVSWGMISSADDLVSYKELEEYYGTTQFVDDDFSCSASR